VGDLPPVHQLQPDEPARGQMDRCRPKDEFAYFDANGRWGLSATRQASRSPTTTEDAGHPYWGMGEGLPALPAPLTPTR
jgi:hypothetical protein